MSLGVNRDGGFPSAMRSQRCNPRADSLYYRRISRLACRHSALPASPGAKGYGSLCYHATVKLMRYSRRHQPSALSRLGVLVGNDLVADLRAGYALYLIDECGNPKGRELAELYMPTYIAQFLHVGEPAWRALGDAYSYLSG